MFDKFNKGLIKTIHAQKKNASNTVSEVTESNPSTSCAYLPRCTCSAQQLSVTEYNPKSSVNSAETICSSDHVALPKPDPSNIYSMNHFSSVTKPKTVIESYEPELVNELNLKRSNHRKDTKLERMQSLSIKSVSVNIHNTNLVATNVSFDPKIFSAQTLKKNSLLIRKHFFKSNMTERPNIKKLMQNYSVS